MPCMLYAPLRYASAIARSRSDQPAAYLASGFAFETPLEQMTNPRVGAIDVLREDTVQLAHPLRQIRIRRLDQQVAVVGHQ